MVQLRGLDFLVFMLYCAKLQCSKAEASLYDDIALYETFRACVLVTLRKRQVSERHHTLAVSSWKYRTRIVSVTV